ncbi:MAG: polysaccharide deacetylase family protein [Actinomycetes bacterium]
MRSQSLVLMYHQIAETKDDPNDLAVSPKNFAAQMSVLKDRCEVVPLSEIQSRSESRSKRPRVAITFDDGYADNGEVGAPILEASGLPASFFITGIAIDGRGEFWWDSLEHLLLDLSDQNAPQDPFEVSIGGQHLRVDLRTRDARLNAHKSLRRPLRLRPPEEIAPVIDALAAHVGSEAPACERHRLAGLSGVQALSRIPGVTIGSHTIRHASLPTLTQEVRRHELAESRRLLEEVIDQPVLEFAFPFGGEGAFDDASEVAVRDAGYVLACRSIFGTVNHRTDPFRIPRAQVYDTGEQDFSTQLDGWFRGRHS